ncbi:hypothetical protein C8J56DRAFT_788047, partial [Mycena floridula]
TPPAGFRIRGIRITEITQSMAYKAILERKTEELGERPATKRNTQAIKQFIQNEMGTRLTTRQIWLSIRTETIPHHIHNFYYYLAIHQGQRIGSWWKHIPECSECQFCYQCPGVVETMSHILFECESPTQCIIWNLACTLFERKGGTWPGTSLAMILGCNLLQFDDGSAKKIKQPGLTRLFH